MRVCTLLVALIFFLCPSEYPVQVTHGTWDLTQVLRYAIFRTGICNLSANIKRHPLPAEALASDSIRVNLPPFPPLGVLGKCGE